MIYFSTGKLRRKKWFGPTKSLFSFPTSQTKKKLGKHDLLVDPMSSFMDIVSHWTGGSEVKLQLFEKLTFLENIFKKN